MRLKPRYSLLTLLVLTALVAGGVKLWHGPHHVVERTPPYAENEYSFTLDLFGQKTVQGVRILRYKQLPGITEHVVLLYYRQGIKANRRQYIYLDPAEKTYAPAFVTEGDEPLELTPSESDELDRAVEQEYGRLQALGYTLKSVKLS